MAKLIKETGFYIDDEKNLCIQVCLKKKDLRTVGLEKVVNDMTITVKVPNSMEFITAYLLETSKESKAVSQPEKINFETFGLSNSGEEQEEIGSIISI